MEVPDVSYARSGDVSIATRVVGEGPPGLVLLVAGVVDSAADPELSEENEHETDPPPTSATTPSRQANRVTAQA